MACLLAVVHSVLEGFGMRQAGALRVTSVLVTVPTAVSRFPLRPTDLKLCETAI